MCVVPSTLGAGAKTRLHSPTAVTYREFRIMKFTPHYVCRPGTPPTLAFPRHPRLKQEGQGPGPPLAGVYPLSVVTVSQVW